MEAISSEGSLLSSCNGLYTPGTELDGLIIDWFLKRRRSLYVKVEITKETDFFKERLLLFYKNGQGFDDFIVPNGALKANRCGTGWLSEKPQFLINPINWIKQTWEDIRYL